MGQQRTTYKIKVANGVKNFMFDEFVFKAKTVRIQDAVFIHDNGVVKAAAPCQADGAQCLDFAGKPEGTCAGDCLDVGIFLEIDLGKVGRGIDSRMLEVNRERQREAVVRFETRPLGVLALTFSYFNRLKHTQEFFRCSLFLPTNTAQKINESARAAIRGGHFVGSQVNVQIVDTQASQSRHQMLDRGYPDIALLQDRSQTRIANLVGA